MSRLLLILLHVVYSQCQNKGSIIVTDKIKGLSFIEIS